MKGFILFHCDLSLTSNNKKNKFPDVFFCGNRLVNEMQVFFLTYFTDNKLGLPRLQALCAISGRLVG